MGDFLDLKYQSPRLLVIPRSLPVLNTKSPIQLCAHYPLCTSSLSDLPPESLKTAPIMSSNRPHPFKLHITSYQTSYLLTQNQNPLLWLQQPHDPLTRLP